MAFTVDQLLDAIRGADSLEDLKRMVGPSDQESQKSMERLAKLDAYFEKYGDYGDDWPEHAKRLMEEQNQFENDFC